MGFSRGLVFPGEVVIPEECREREDKEEGTRHAMDVFGASRGPRPSADGPGHPRMAWCPRLAWQNRAIRGWPGYNHKSKNYLGN